MAGLGVLVEFQALVKPSRVIARLTAATLGSGDNVGSPRMTIASKRAEMKIIEDLRTIIVEDAIAIGG